MGGENVGITGVLGIRLSSMSQKNCWASGMEADYHKSMKIWLSRKWSSWSLPPLKKRNLRSRTYMVPHHFRNLFVTQCIRTFLVPFLLCLFIFGLMYSYITDQTSPKNNCLHLHLLQQGLLTMRAAKNKLPSDRITRPSWLNCIGPVSLVLSSLPLSIPTLYWLFVHMEVINFFDLIWFDLMNMSYKQGRIHDPA